YDYTCIAETSIAGKIDIGMKVSPNVTVPETVESEGKLTLENISSDIEIDLEGNLNDLRTLINPFNGHVKKFDITANGQTQNGVGKEGSPIPSTPHKAGDKYIPFNVKGKNATFNAGKEDVEIHVGEIIAVINAKLGPTPIDLEVTCNPNDGVDTLYTTVPIEKEEEPTEPEEPGDGDGDGEEPTEPEEPGDRDGEEPTDPREPNGNDEKKEENEVYVPVNNGKGGPSTDVPSGGKVLPKTATSNPLLINSGSIMTVLGGAMVFISKKKKLIEEL